jgi:hypothetical protein
VSVWRFGSGSGAGVRMPAVALFPLRPGYDHIDLSAAAAGADEPGAPIEHRRCGAVPFGHLAGVGLDLVLTVLAPNDKPELGSGGATQRHRRAGLGFHFGSGAPVRRL